MATGAKRAEGITMSTKKRNTRRALCNLRSFLRIQNGPTRGLPLVNIRHFQIVDYINWLSQVMQRNSSVIGCVMTS